MESVTFGPALAVTARPQEPVKRAPHPPIPPDKRQEMMAARLEKEALIRARIESFHEYAAEYAWKMAKDFEKTEQYFLHLLYSGSPHFKTSRKPNAYNAWSSKMVKEINENVSLGKARGLIDIRRELKDQYTALSEEEKAELISQLEETRTSKKYGVHLSARAKLQDIINSSAEIESIMYGLKLQCGVKGFYCIVKSEANVVFDPHWYFTALEMNVYLSRVVRKGWDVQAIGALAEAFSVAGCDWMTEITGNQKVKMNYTSFERDIVIKYGIDIVGWTYEKFVNPSEMSTSLPPLRKLSDAIKDGMCKFIQLSQAEHRAREKEYNCKVDTGEVEPRKERQDKGVPRGKCTHPKGEDDDGDGDELAGSTHRTKQPLEKRRRMMCNATTSKKTAPKSAAIILDEDEDEPAGTVTTSIVAASASPANAMPATAA